MHVGYTCGASCPGSLNPSEGAGGDDRRYGINEKKRAPKRAEGGAEAEVDRAVLHILTVLRVPPAPAKFVRLFFFFFSFLFSFRSASFFPSAFFFRDPARAVAFDRAANNNDPIVGNVLYFSLFLFLFYTWIWTVRNDTSENDRNEKEFFTMNFVQRKINFDGVL